MRFGFGFDYGFAVVKRYDGGYFEAEVVFGNGCFEEGVEIWRKRKHIGDFDQSCQ